LPVSPADGGKGTVFLLGDILKLFCVATGFMKSVL